MLPSVPSDRIAAYIRKNTPVDARVFSPEPLQMTYLTGRSNARGYADGVTVRPVPGPRFRDVFNYLEAAAVRRLGFDYVHATDEWIEGLPDEAAARLNDPNLFELLVRDESESLYRVLPAFLTLDAPPTPESYEALRRAVPASATVFLPEIFQSNRITVTGWALPNPHLVGMLGRQGMHLLAARQIEPLQGHTPDLIITLLDFEPWMFPTASRQPIWWDDVTAVYALDGAVDPIMPPPPRAEPLPFSVRVSDASEADGRIAFTATFDDRASDQWTSQDWILIATKAPPWHIPAQLLPNGTPAPAMWFVSYLNPGQGTTSLTYQFDFREPSLAVQREHGVLKPLDRSEGVLESGSFLLTVRLRHEYKPEQWRAVAYIPVLRITVSETGEVSYQVHEEAGG